jgi:hypothetical protein
MSINFKVSDNGNLINVSYNGEMTCEEFILDFTKNNTNLQTSDPNVYTFKASGKILNSPIFIKKKLKDIVKDQQIVYFVRKQNMHYSKINKNKYYIYNLNKKI